MRAGHVFRSLAAVVMLAGSIGAGERWEVKLFHDEDRSSLSLRDIAFTSPLRGLAIGTLVIDGKPSGAAVITADGGKTWQYVKTPDHGYRLFCLDDANCWMTAPGGVFFSNEGGRQWRRVLRHEGLTRVFFTSQEHGWAIGAKRTVLETRDGGRTWSPIQALKNIQASDRLVFHAIAFTTPKNGIIAGRSEPMQRRREPIWMDDRPEHEAETPSLTVTLTTSDGGEKWQASSTSVFGRISEIAAALDGRVLGLVSFTRYFPYPSEIHHIYGQTGKSTRTLRQKNLAATDVIVIDKGPAYAAGYEPPGALALAPIPGKLRVLRSNDLDEWTDMEVDYRAVAQYVALAAAGPNDVWMATDTGMILKLVRD